MLWELAVPEFGGCRVRRRFRRWALGLPCPALLRLAARCSQRRPTVYAELWRWSAAAHQLAPGGQLILVRSAAVAVVSVTLTVTPTLGPSGCRGGGPRGSADRGRVAASDVSRPSADSACDLLVGHGGGRDLDIGPDAETARALEWRTARLRGPGTSRRTWRRAVDAT